MRLIFLTAMLIGSLVGSGTQIVRAQSAEEIRTIAKEAYIFAFPMLDNYMTLYQQTEDVGYSG